jgi:hypothetical protein
MNATLRLVESDTPFNQREDRVIPTKADILAGAPLRAALPNDDVSRNNVLASEFLHAKTLAVTVAPVLDGSLAFLVCHISRSIKCLRELNRRALGADRGDLQLRQAATETDLPMVAFPALVFVSDHLRPLVVLDDLGDDAG